MRAAVMSPFLAAVTTARTTSSASPSINLSASNDALCREPRAQPCGLPLTERSPALLFRCFVSYPHFLGTAWALYEPTFAWLTKFYERIRMWGRIVVDVRADGAGGVGAGDDRIRPGLPIGGVG
jgi:hypothetical protein